jgi:hypothetical protein
MDQHVTSTGQPLAEFSAGEKADLPDGLFSRWAVQPDREKYFASRFGRNSFIDSNRPVPTRGALRGRHGRWVRDAMDAARW